MNEYLPKPDGMFAKRCWLPSPDGSLFEFWRVEDEDGAIFGSGFDRNEAIENAWNELLRRESR